MISIIIIGIGIINNQSVQLVFLRLATIIPMIRWLALLVNNLKHDILRLEIIEKDLFMESEKNMDDVLNVQKSIFEHRKECTIERMSKEQGKLQTLAGIQLIIRGIIINELARSNKSYAELMNLLKGKYDE